MNFFDYQYRAMLLRVCPDTMYPLLGLGGEAGEVLEKFKKQIRDDNWEQTPEFKESIKKELGDVLWYVAAIAHDLQLSLQDIAEGNIAKLEDRRDRGVLLGSGDDR